MLTVSRGTIPKDSVLMRGGKSAEVGAAVAMPPGAAILDAAGRYLMPGIINPHAHVTQKCATNEGRVAVSSVAVAFGEGIRGSPTFRIEEPTPPVREQAWKLFSGHRDKEYDLIDCISFATMESLRIRDVFGFDHHFSEYGFHLLPDR